MSALKILIIIATCLLTSTRRCIGKGNLGAFYRFLWAHLLMIVFEGTLCVYVYIAEFRSLYRHEFLYQKREGLSIIVAHLNFIKLSPELLGFVSFTMTTGLGLFFFIGYVSQDYAFGLNLNLRVRYHNTKIYFLRNLIEAKNGLKNDYCTDKSIDNIKRLLYESVNWLKKHDAYLKGQSPPRNLLKLLFLEP